MASVMTSPDLWRSDRVRLSILAIAWLLFVVAVYCPDVGRGFVKDDFTWIRAAKTAIAYPSTIVRQRDVGFYRPAITLTFLADYAWHGWHARGYGWTNLALCGLCAAALAGLARTLGLSRWAAALSAFLWTINPHGINMAVVWLSGRTALCLTLFCVLAAVAFVRRWYVVAGVLIAMALASKEEAVMLPAILLLWAWLGGEDGRVSWRAIGAACIPLCGYFVMRSVTPALTPATAPPFYQFTTDPLLLLRNIAEYVDRTTTLVAAVVAIAMILFRMRPSLGGVDRRVVAMMAAWWAGMLAITVWLPVRSSLYAVCPSVASAIVGAMLLDRMQARAARGRPWFEPVLATLVLAAVPIYQLRNDRWVEAARVSQRALTTIGADAAVLPHAGSIVLDDEPGISSFRNAFGDLAAAAFQTTFDAQWDARIEPHDSSSIDAGPFGEIAAEYRMEHGRISRVVAR
ncbi:MAG TPA: hypothetical protein VG222_19710 [Vicinamibacterales bacterium]|nr:hypothetical protein [Vicinamibacterales bacterium]